MPAEDPISQAEDEDPAAPDRRPEDQTKLIRALDDPTAVMLFQTAESRRYTVDQMMWQVPALSLTAQAFLLQIAYSHDSRWTVRLVTAWLGLVTAAAAIQLLLKHRYHEELHSHWLERYAETRGWPLLHRPRAEEAFAYAGQEHPWKAQPRWIGWRIARFRSPYVWIATLVMFGCADLVVVAGWADHVVTSANPFG
jgi:hypothetical protein